MIKPELGEVWLLPDVTVQPGGQLVLVISGHIFNNENQARIVVDVVTAESAAGALLVPIGQLGVALIGRPWTAPLDWFPSDPAAEPFATLDEKILDRVTDNFVDLIGRRR